MPWRVHAHLPAILQDSREAWHAGPHHEPPLTDELYKTDELSIDLPSPFHFPFAHQFWAASLLLLGASVLLSDWVWPPRFNAASARRSNAGRLVRCRSSVLLRAFAALVQGASAQPMQVNCDRQFHLGSCLITTQPCRAERQYASRHKYLRRAGRVLVCRALVRWSNSGGRLVRCRTGLRRGGVTGDCGKKCMALFCFALLPLCSAVACNNSELAASEQLEVSARAQRGEYAQGKERGRHFLSSAGAFIPIPKTAATSIRRACNVTLYSQCHRWNPSIEDSVAQHRVCTLKTARGTCLPSMGHFVDDVARRQFNSSSLVTLRPSFCVVREPAERWYSARHSGQSTRYNFSLSDDAVASAFARGRFGVGSWTEQLLHMQPQSWFVWDDDGNVTCDCVVAFEKLGNVTEIRANAGRKPSTTPVLPKPLQRLYLPDFQLHRAAYCAPGLCYWPRSSQARRHQLDSRMGVSRPGRGTGREGGGSVNP